MLKKEETEVLINEWLDDIIRRAQINLGARQPRYSPLTRKTKQRRINASGTLSKSLEKSVKVSKNSFTASISMEDYGEYVDLGRKPGKGISYNDLNVLTKWMKQKPVRIRSKDGAFTRQTEAAITNFAKFISWKIKRYGIEPTNFFTDAILAANEKFGEELTEALFNDLEEAYFAIFKQIQN